MTKPNTIDKKPPAETIFRPYTAYVRKVQKVDISESGDIHVVYGDRIRFTCNLICCNNDVKDPTKTEILQFELQLNYEFLEVIKALRKQGNLLEEAALVIDMAKRSEALALRYSSLYIGEYNKKLALDLIYLAHTRKFYGVAINLLQNLLRNDKFLNKQMLGEMLIFAHGKYLAAAILIGNEIHIVRAKELGKTIDNILVRMGLGNVIDQHAKVEGFEIKHDTYLPLFTAPISALGNMFSKIFGSDDQSQVLDEKSRSTAPSKESIKNKKNQD